MPPLFILIYRLAYYDETKNDLKWDLELEKKNDSTGSGHMGFKGTR